MNEEDDEILSIDFFINEPADIMLPDELEVEGLTYKVDEKGDITEITLSHDALRAYQRGEFDPFEYITNKITPSKPAVPKTKPPMSPDPSYGGNIMKTATSPIAHFWGQSLTAGGSNAGRLRNSWEENQINGHPKFARANMTHGGGEATVYFDPKTIAPWNSGERFTALTIWYSKPTR